MASRFWQCATGAVVLVVLLAPPAAAYDHYPDRDAAASYYASPCSAALQFVVDLGAVFSEAFGPAIEQLACSIAQNYSAELVVATMNRVGHDGLPAYTEGVFQAWNVGGLQEVGVLLLFTWEYGSTEQPAIWLHVGHGLQTAFGPEVRRDAFHETQTGFEKNLRRGMDERAALEVGLARGAASLADAIVAAHGQNGFPAATTRPVGPLSFWGSTVAFGAIVAAMGAAAILLEMRRGRS